MNIYNYDENGFYTTTTEARLDPIDETPMIPARATTEAVPTATIESYQKYKFNGTAWIVEDIQEIIDSMLAETNEKGTLLYDEVNGLPVGRATTAIEADDAEADKQVLRNASYDGMLTDIYNELETTFGTKKPETATADYNTFKIMSAKPELFSTQGLVAEHTTTTYAKGDALDTDTKIQTYANEMISAIESYAVYRMNRKKQYADEVIAIG